MRSGTKVVSAVSVSASIFIIIVLQTALAEAFINVEAIRRETGEGFFGSSSLRIAGQRGNTNKLAGNVSSLNIFRDLRDEFLLLGDYSYAYSADIRDTNNARAHFRYTYGHREIYAPEIFAQTEFDEFKDLNSRHIFGANLRSLLSTADDRTLALGTGLFYEIEDYAAIDTRYGVRGNFYVAYTEKFSDYASGSSVIYYQPMIKEFRDYRIRMQMGLESLVTTQLSLNLEFNLTHDNWVPKEIVKTDMSYLAGFSFKY